MNQLIGFQTKNYFEDQKFDAGLSVVYQLPVLQNNSSIPYVMKKCCKKYKKGKRCKNCPKIN